MITIFRCVCVLQCTFFNFYIAQNFVEPEINTTELYKTNVRKITFMPEDIAVKDYKESDFLTELAITKKSELYLRAFMPNSLTNYLHELSPSLTAEELDKVGNFQFVFYIDGEKIYTENLHHGAFGLENKNSRRTFKIPLITSKKVDSWGWYLWKRFLVNGGEDALSNGIHPLKIEIRPYVLFPNELIGELIAQGELKLIITKREKKASQKSIAIQQISENSTLQFSDKKYNEELIKDLNKKIAQEKFKDISSIVVIDEGKLLIEEYFNKEKRNSLHDTRSATKTILSTLVGIAIKEGYIKNIDQKLGEFYDLKKYNNYSSFKDSITIKHLLTMSSGFEGNDFDEQSAGNEEKMYPQKNWVNWALNLPMAKNKKPGEHWAYFSAGCIILGNLLNTILPNGLEVYCKEKLFKPLGITNYKWQYTPQKVVNTAGGLSMSAIDFAKFGQLYKNEGIYNNKQIIEKDWVVLSLTKYFNKVSENDNYGFLFWNKNYKVNEQEYETNFCSGNGGNKIFIFKNLPYVIVITAKAYNTVYMHKQIDKIMQKYLIPALIN